MRADVFELPNLKEAQGHEQRGPRYCVVIQGDDFTDLSTWVVCPTSTSSEPRFWRPEITVLGKPTVVLVEQMRAIDPRRLGRKVDFVRLADMQDIDEAIKTVLGLR